jgi:hypothetical protein
MVANRDARIALVVGLAAIVFAAGCGDDKKSTNSPVDQSITVNLDYYVALDLETGDTASADIIAPPTPAEMDFHFAYYAPSAPHTYIFQRGGRQIAALYNRTFSSVNAVDADTASYTTSYADSAFSAGRVFLIKTDVGAVYKLGNPVETASSADGCTFDYAQLTD